MGRIGNAWELMKVCLKTIREDKTMLLYPLVSGIVLILIVISFFAGIFFTGLFGLGPLVIVFFIIFYFVMFFIGIYFNTALVAHAMMKLEGGSPTFGDGIRLANENLGAILKWSIVAATVGLILRMIEERVGIIGKIIISIIGFAWAMATFFIIPVLIYEKAPIMTGIKRSAGIFKNTWGETLIGHFAFGIFFVLLGLLAIIPIILGAMIGGFWGFIAGAILAMIWVVFVALLANAAQGVLVAALYRFATTGKISPDFPAHLVAPTYTE